MIESIHRHSILSIIFCAFVAIILVFRFQYLPAAQFSILATLIFLYLGWAIYYHKKDKSLTLEVAIEYILTALLALVILYGILI